jgi:hypothetical protein
MLYKPARLSLTAENDTERGTFRIVPGIAAAGFVVQPFLADHNDLGSFLKGQGARRALRIRFDPADGQAYFWKSFDVQISRMDALPIHWPSAK